MINAERYLLLVLIALLFSILATAAEADTILSLATKQSISQQSSQVTNGTVITKIAQDVPQTSMGVILQSVVYDNVILGVGLFQDNTGIASIGWRFK